MTKKIYPAIFIKQAVVLPNEKISLILEGKEAIATAESAIKGDRFVVLLFQKGEKQDDIGVLAQIHQFWYLSPMVAGLAVEGIKRVKITDFYGKKEISQAEMEEAEEINREDIETVALSRSLFEHFKKLMQLEGIIPFAFVNEIQKEDIPPGKTSDVIAAALGLSVAEKLKLLELLDVKKRLEFLDIKLTKELSIVEAKRKIQKEVEKRIGKEQRELILREQIKAIEKELGIFEEEKEYEEIAKKIKKAAMPKDIEERALKELYRLKTMTTFSAEAPYIRAYLDWLIELPWSVKTESFYDLKKARQILDEDHYGLDKAKERVLEFLAVQKLTKGKGRGTIMCFAGPPGTGKTSVGKSIARALGRKFVRISLGGIRDEAEIRGHRRTYVGALPGRIIQGIKTAGAKNPVFMLDEIDKIGFDFRGDPSSALLEVLDPEQNNSFSDHYLEVPFDLSEVFFITTANILDPVPPALRDRMEVIEFLGYTDEEKIHIAKNFLIPKIILSHGLNGKKISFSGEAVKKVVHKYTREAGVRNLERRLAEITRKIAKKMAEKEIKNSATISGNDVSAYLGPEEYKVTMREAKDETGIATGLAWTPVGGEIMFIEAAVIPGQGHLTLTGQLGEVMQESAKAALSYIRSRSKELGFDRNFYRKSDIHIHVPAGAIPKDGPSAGIAIATALTSALNSKKVKKEVALTGEITLSGKILEIGGVKEKVLAAYRAGVETVILPRDNEKNLTDIPEEIRKNLKFKLVNHMDEVLKVALK